LNKEAYRIFLLKSLQSKSISLGARLDGMYGKRLQITLTTWSLPNTYCK